MGSTLLFNRTVLFLEDDPNYRGRVSEELQRRGYEVHSAAAVEEAIDSSKPISIKWLFPISTLRTTTRGDCFYWTMMNK
jgi:ActR/RegA family two-component response regulator